MHWDQELSGVVRRTYDVLGLASPALLFENIIDYPPPGPNCGRDEGKSRSGGQRRLLIYPFLRLRKLLLKAIYSRERHGRKGPLENTPAIMVMFRVRHP